MKIPFSIEYRPQIESGEYKVETRDRRPVRIVSWDFLSEKPIIGLIGMGFNDGETIATYYKQGRVTTAHDDCADLFIITPEPELSEFEKAIKDLVLAIDEGEYQNLGVFEEENLGAWAVKKAAELLVLARKELEPEVLERLEIAYKNQDEVVYENGKREGKSEALKDLPRWIDDGLPKGSGAIDISGLCGFDFIRRNGKLLRISDIEKLPGFNE